MYNELVAIVTRRETLSIERSSYLPRVLAGKPDVKIGKSSRRGRNRGKEGWGLKLSSSLHEQPTFDEPYRSFPPTASGQLLRRLLAILVVVTRFSRDQSS